MSFETIDERLNGSEKSLLSGAFFADKNDEVFNFEQAQAYAEVLRNEDRKLEIGRLKAQLRDAEPRGQTAEAFEIISHLNQLERATRK